MADKKGMTPEQLERDFYVGAGVAALVTEAFLKANPGCEFTQEAHLVNLRRCHELELKAAGSN